MLNDILLRNENLIEDREQNAAHGRQPSASDESDT